MDIEFHSAGHFVEGNVYSLAYGFLLGWLGNQEKKNQLSGKTLQPTTTTTAQFDKGALWINYKPEEEKNSSNNTSNNSNNNSSNQQRK